MRYAALPIAALVLLALVTETGLSQNSANQTLSFAVNQVSKLVVSGNPGPMTVSDGTAGSDALTSVSNSGTSYSITHNSMSDLQITAALNLEMPAGTKLEISLESGKGDGGTTIDITNASGTGVPVVTNIAKGADMTRTITYTFSANASAGAMSSFNRTVTLTLTN